MPLFGMRFNINFPALKHHTEAVCAGLSEAFVLVGLPLAQLMVEVYTERSFLQTSPLLASVEDMKQSSGVCPP